MNHMNLQTPHDSEHIADLLPAFVNGTLNPRARTYVQQHLLHCEACSNELATWQALRETAQLSLAATPLPATHTLTQVWAKLEAAPQPTVTSATQETPSISGKQRTQVIQLTHQTQLIQTPFWHSLVSSLLHYWLVLKRQVPIIHLSIWLTAPLVIFFGGGLAFYDIIILHTVGIASNWSLPLFTTVSATAGAAFIYGQENDAGFEITLSTPTSIRIVMLCRTFLVVSYNVLLAAIASTVIAVAHGGGLWQTIQMWLGPMLLLSTFTLALSMLLGSWVSLLVSIVLETGQAFLLNVDKHMAFIQLNPASMSIWQTNPMMLILAVLFIMFAILYAPKQPRLSN